MPLAAVSIDYRKVESKAKLVLSDEMFLNFVTYALPFEIRT